MYGNNLLGSDELKLKKKGIFIRINLTEYFYGFFLRIITSEFCNTYLYNFHKRISVGKIVAYR